MHQEEAMNPGALYGRIFLKIWRMLESDGSRRYYVIGTAIKSVANFLSRGRVWLPGCVEMRQEEINGNSTRYPDLLAQSGHPDWTLLH
jgi:hypothetical protein